uniref:Uncharacterized protein n=1 Tax=Steinernema glaseri TaxID=37863 RepID=A0A1I7ZHA9_9BILA
MGLAMLNIAVFDAAATLHIEISITNLPIICLPVGPTEPYFTMTATIIFRFSAQIFSAPPNDSPSGERVSSSALSESRNAIVAHRALSVRAQRPPCSGYAAALLTPDPKLLKHRGLVLTNQVVAAHRVICHHSTGLLSRHSNHNFCLFLFETFFATATSEREVVIDAKWNGEAAEEHEWGWADVTVARSLFALRSASAPDCQAVDVFRRSGLPKRPCFASDAPLFRLELAQLTEFVLEILTTFALDGILMVEDAKIDGTKKWFQGGLRAGYRLSLRRAKVQDGLFSTSETMF